jgi:hypothetical protein
MAHDLEPWKPYLSYEDYEYLIKFVENAMNFSPNYKMILFTGGREKNSLISDISNYLGDGKFINCDIYGSAFFEPIVNVIHVPFVEDFQKKYIQQLINVIQYGQSIIAQTERVNKVNINIMGRTRVIKILEPQESGI